MPVYRCVCRHEDCGQLFETTIPDPVNYPTCCPECGRQQSPLLKNEADRARPLASVSTEDVIRELIDRMGADHRRPELRDTPTRVMRSWKQLFGGYAVIDVPALLKTFNEPSADEMIVCKDIEFYSTCEHHLLPFYGKAHVAYIPNGGKVVGLSKLPRLVDAFARRLQIQERVTDQVTSALMKAVNPLGAACLIEAKHLCVCSRGVGKQNSVMVTSSMKGVFRDKPEVRAEFMACVRAK